MPHLLTNLWLAHLAPQSDQAIGQEHSQREQKNGTATPRVGFCEPVGRIADKGNRHSRDHCMYESDQDAENNEQNCSHTILKCRKHARSLRKRRITSQGFLLSWHAKSQRCLRLKRGSCAGQVAHGKELAIGGPHKSPQAAGLGQVATLHFLCFRWLILGLLSGYRTLRRGTARTPNFDDAMPTGYVPRRTMPLSHKGMSDVTDKLGQLINAY